MLQSEIEILFRKVVESGYGEFSESSNDIKESAIGDQVFTLNDHLNQCISVCTNGLLIKLYEEQGLIEYSDIVEIKNFLNGPAISYSSSMEEGHFLLPLHLIVEKKEFKIKLPLVVYPSFLRLLTSFSPSAKKQKSHGH